MWYASYFSVKLLKYVNGLHIPAKKQTWGLEKWLNGYEKLLGSMSN